MNNKQFILIIFWISIVSAMIGYHVGGIMMAFFVGVVVPAVFLMCGD